MYVYFIRRYYSYYGYKISPFDVMEKSEKNTVLWLMPFEILLIKLTAYLCSYCELDNPVLYDIRHYVPQNILAGMFYALMNILDKIILFVENMCVLLIDDICPNGKMYVVIGIIVLFFLTVRDKAYFCARYSFPNAIFIAISMLYNIRFIVFVIMKSDSIFAFAIAFLVSKVLAIQIYNLSGDMWHSFILMKGAGEDWKKETK